MEVFLDPNPFAALELVMIGSRPIFRRNSEQVQATHSHPHWHETRADQNVTRLPRPSISVNSAIAV